MSFDPIPLKPSRKRPLLLILSAVILTALAAGFIGYQYFFAPSSARWGQFQDFHRNPTVYAEVVNQPGQRCGDAPFAFPTTGAIFGLWRQPYGVTRIHAGLDIFSGTEPGKTPVYAAYPGYLTRRPTWISTVIIRIPEDPLQPNRQIWNYYTHMADTSGETSFIAPEFPPGTAEVFVPAGTLLGYQGTWSGNPDSPTGLHLHFSVVKDDGSGSFLNELEVENTYDPSPYLGMSVNQDENPDGFPVCESEISYENWDLEAGE